MSMQQMVCFVLLPCRGWCQCYVMLVAHHEACSAQWFLKATPVGSWKAWISQIQHSIIAAVERTELSATPHARRCPAALAACANPPPPTPTHPHKACQLRSLVLHCSHASVYAATQSMESLSRLTALTSLRMGPNPEDIFPHTSPLGFPQVPSFIGSLLRLREVDISMADSATTASLTALDLWPISHVPDVKLTLRADTSIRTVAHLPASISSVTGLNQLTVQVGEEVLLLSRKLGGQKRGSLSLGSALADTHRVQLQYSPSH